MNKKIVGILCSFLVITSGSIHADKTLFENQIDTYIGQLVDHLFYPHHNHPDRTILIDTIAKNSRTNAPVKPVFWDRKERAYLKIYDQSFIDEQVRSEVLNWIKNQAYLYAKMVSTDQASKKLVEQIAEQLNSQITDTNPLQQGVFSAYVGKHLRVKVNQMVTKIVLEDKQCACSPTHSTH